MASRWMRIVPRANVVSFHACQFTEGLVPRAFGCGDLCGMPHASPPLARGKSSFSHLRILLIIITRLYVLVYSRHLVFYSHIIIKGSSYKGLTLQSAHECSLRGFLSFIHIDPPRIISSLSIASSSSMSLPCEIQRCARPCDTYASASPGLLLLGLCDAIYARPTVLHPVFNVLAQIC
ncbi:hypothetical protein HAX54_035866 [Datura stramonium]|uniref:Uncharacterized protein n=1 Tax=Datura stramonium TaxID=4076 RepID=A0ABS8SFZ5_DATST|nr:hypothetical protein [Datura stramonium]